MIDPTFPRMFSGLRYSRPWKIRPGNASAHSLRPGMGGTQGESDSATAATTTVSNSSVHQSARILLRLQGTEPIFFNVRVHRFLPGSFSIRSTRVEYDVTLPFSSSLEFNPTEEAYWCICRWSKRFGIRHGCEKYKMRICRRAAG